MCNEPEGSGATEVDDILFSLKAQRDLLTLSEKYDITAGDNQMCCDLHKALDECEESVKAARARYMRRMANIARSNRNVG